MIEQCGRFPLRWSVEILSHVAGPDKNGPKDGIANGASIWTTIYTCSAGYFVESRRMRAVKARPVVLLKVRNCAELMSLLTTVGF